MAQKKATCSSQPIFYVILIRHYGRFDYVYIFCLILFYVNLEKQGFEKYSWEGQNS